ncbi:MAG: hypothetical protein WCP39_05425 [Chlamydiota bacterium]
MNKLISSILFFGWCLSLGAAEEQGSLIQTYYKNQSYPHLSQINKESSNYLSEEKDQNDKQHVLNVATIFMAQVLKNHPEYLNQYVQNFSNLSFYEKAVFLRGIRSAGMDHALLHNLSDKKLQELVNDPNLLALSQLQVKQAGDLDYLWASFFATGDETYILQIIKILNRDDELLFLAYEWINREQVAQIRSSLEGTTTPPDYSDLKKIIEKQSSKRKDYQTQFLISLTALKSLEDSSTQDPNVGDIIKKIIENDPSLDYFKRINAALGNEP